MNGLQNVPMMRNCPTLCAGLFLITSSMMAQSTLPRSVYVPVGEDSVWVGVYEPVVPNGAPALLLVPGFPVLDEDALELGRRLSERGSHVFVMQPRGHGRSSGWFTYTNALEDVDAVLAWLRTAGAGVGVRRPVALGGYSFGGGLTLAYAAEHPEVERLVAIAPTNAGVFIRRVDSDSAYGQFFRSALKSLEAPTGPVRFSVEADFAELRSDFHRHDLATIAPRLADRDLLLIVGWDDQAVEIEHQFIPFYRALRSAQASNVRVVALHDDHQYSAVRAEVASMVHEWLTGATP